MRLGGYWWSASIRVRAASAGYNGTFAQTALDSLLYVVKICTPLLRVRAPLSLGNRAIVQSARLVLLRNIWVRPMSNHKTYTQV